MFPYPIATPQGCNIQTFYGSGGTSSAARNSKTWNKPVGVSHVYMLLIGGGGPGNSVDTGGGSGAVTVWYGAAQHVPDNLVVFPAISAGDSYIYYRTNGLATLLYALGAAGIVGGVAMDPNYFSASGFFSSTTGQDGSAGVSTTSSTTFLSGGAGSSGTIVAPNYGYQIDNSAGFFMMQPIIVGGGGAGTKNGGIGCGGGVTGKGGPGMVLIASW